MGFKKLQPLSGEYSTEKYGYFGIDVFYRDIIVS